MVHEAADGPVVPGLVRRIGRKVAVAIASATVVGTACGSGTPASPPEPAGPPTPAHVVVVVLENKDTDQVLGSPKAPYLNALAAGAAVLADSHAVAHPSQPNYLALFAGDTFGLTSDRCPLSFDRPNLAGLLTASGRSFTGFAEDLPDPGFSGCTAGGYARKHAPWTDFPALPAEVGKPFSAFGPDYAQLPTVSFVVPNLCDDMHDCGVATGDAWLRDHLDGYLRWAAANNSMLVLTFDEDDADSADNHIATIVAGPMVTPGRYDQRVDHYSVLRTIEDAYQLPHAGQSENAAPITGIWRS